MLRIIGIGVVALFIVAIAACGGDSDQPEATATVSGIATAAPSATRATVSATTAGTPVTTATSRPPTATATATPAPTDTPVPEPTATEVPPTDTPVPPTDTPVPPTATSPPPPPTATSAPPPAAGPQSRSITAQALKFSPTTIAVSAGATVTITLNNQDNFVPHDIAVTGLGKSASCSGPCTTSVTFTAPGPGSYGFICTIHPYMTGTLVVQ